MSTPTKLQIVQGGRALELKSVRLTDTAIANCLPHKDAKQAVDAQAAAEYDEANAGTLAEARSRKKHLSIDSKTERKIKAKVGKRRDKLTGIYAKTPARPDGKTRMSWPERLTHWMFVLFRFGLLGVTIALIAMYVRSSTYSADLSTSWPMALAFGFPVLLLSYALSSIAEGTDDLEAKRRIARRYTWIGALVLFGWALCTAVLFCFDTGGADAGFTVNFDASAAAMQVDWASAMFPKTVAGKLLLLTHVVGDVLISAACGVWSKLVGLKGRETTFDEPNDARAYREQNDLQAGRLVGLEAQIDHIARIEADYPAGRLATVTDAVNRLTAMQREFEARRLLAESDTIRSFAVVK
jgi:hypothetical protein